MFYQILFSPQVKRCVIITFEHGIYELPHELPNDLSLKIPVPTALSPLKGAMVPTQEKKKSLKISGT